MSSPREELDSMLYTFPFGLFPALENSVHDHRIEELLSVIEHVFDLYARLWSEAAAADDQAMADGVGEQYKKMANWWHRFAAHEVSAIDATSALEAYQAEGLLTEADSVEDAVAQVAAVVGGA